MDAQVNSVSRAVVYQLHLVRRKTGQCVPRSWIYLLKEQSADLATEGRPHMRTELFSGKCPDSIIVQETDRDYQRILLYSRVLHPAEGCISDFKGKASCLDMNEFLLIPRTQAPSPCFFLLHLQTGFGLESSSDGGLFQTEGCPLQCRAPVNLSQM
uniref:Apolipoprotein M n=1 Tax=Podarcis muralis TaxID=64176 RepID=A0A670HYQ3_PODMU